MVCCG